MEEPVGERVTVICRNIPESLRRALKAAAAADGITMQQFILEAVEKALERREEK